MNKLIEALTSSDNFSPNPEMAYDYKNVDDALRQIKDRFIEERTHGWTHPDTGIAYPPVSPEEAERRWLAVKPKFQRVLLTPDDYASKRLGLKKAMPSSTDYRDTANPSSASWRKDAEFTPPEMDPAEYDQGWERATAGPYERGMQDEPSLRRGESKAVKIVNKLIG